MPYKDPEKQKAAKREYARRRAAAERVPGAGREARDFGGDQPRDLPEPPGRDELVKLLGLQARNGSVRAIELLLKMEPDEEKQKPSSTLAAIHDLAQRRAS